MARVQTRSIQFWRGTGETSERGSDSATPHLRGIADASGRLMVVATHNTDSSGAWSVKAKTRTTSTNIVSAATQWRLACCPTP
ncbi:MAG: hypothetical protein ABI880_02860 [Acidobacteriota bacterium]